MTSFKITTDDVGVRGIQEGNKTPVISGPVIPVKASNPVQKSPEHLPIEPVQTDRGGSEVHHTQRRHADRRKADHPVLLETRNQHDRRTKTEKIDDDENNNVGATLHGIDEII